MNSRKILLCVTFAASCTAMWRPALWLPECGAGAAWADAKSSASLSGAIRAGDLDAVKDAIAAGADLNAPDAQKLPPICLAARLGKADIVEFLADKGADVNVSDGQGLTPLMCAASLGQAGAARMLLKHGADPSLKGANGSDPLTCATPTGDADELSDGKLAVKKLIEAAVARPKVGGLGALLNPASPGPNPVPKPGPDAPEKPAPEAGSSTTRFHDTTFTPPVGWVAEKHGEILVIHPPKDEPGQKVEFVLFPPIKSDGEFKDQVVAIIEKMRGKLTGLKQEEPTEFKDPSGCRLLTARSSLEGAQGEKIVRMYRAALVGQSVDFIAISFSSDTGKFSTDSVKAMQGFVASLKYAPAGESVANVPEPVKPVTPPIKPPVPTPPVRETPLAAQYREKAELGDPRSMYGYAILLSHGTQVSKSDAGAIQWFTKSAEAGYLAAMAELAHRYDKGIGVEKDAALAKQWTDRAIATATKQAKAGDIKAMVWLGDLYEKGRIVQRDPAQAGNFYSAAAEQGDSTAMLRMGQMLLASPQGDKDAAVALVRRAADAGNPTAMHYIARLYGEGILVSRDVEKAQAWYQKILEKGNDWEKLEIGDLYLEGTQLPKDPAAALAAYQKASENYPARAERIGLFYAGFAGGAHDDAQAVKWFQKAAEQHSLVAAYRLGLAYEMNRGVEGNMDEALKWFGRAASVGDPKSAQVLTDLRLDSVAPEINSGGAPLELFLYSSADVVGRDFYYDWKALKAAGVSKDAPLKYSAKNIKWGDALTAALKIAGDGKAAYADFDGTVLVSTPERIKAIVLRNSVHSEQKPDEANLNMSFRLKVPVTDIHFSATTLGDAIDTLQAKTDTTIEADWDKLAAAGVTKNTPINFDSKVASLSHILEILLADAEGTVPLDYVLIEDRIVVTTLLKSPERSGHAQ